MSNACRLAVPCVVVCAFMLASPPRDAHAAPVVVTGVTGTATAQTHPDVGDPDLQTGSPSVPSTGAVHAKDLAGNSADINWNFGDLSDRTRLRVDMDAFGNEAGSAENNLTLDFTTDAPVQFNLVVHAQSVGGGGVNGKIDAHAVTVDFDPLTDPVFIDTRSDSGTLPAGAHTFTVTGSSGIDRGTQVPLIGDVTLDLSTGPIAAIPLPSAMVPGIALLICVIALRPLSRSTERGE